MEERIKEILLHYGGMATKQIEVTEDDSILYEATQAILTAVAESCKQARIDELIRVQDRWGGVRSASKQSWIDERIAQLGKEE